MAIPVDGPWDERGNRAIRTVRDRGGFILIAVLWLLVALGAVGLNAAMTARTERLAAANLLDAARAREVALAGTEYARSRLTAAMLDRADELRAQQRSNRGRSSRNRNQSVRSLFRGADPRGDNWREPEQLMATEMVFGDTRFTLRVRDSGAALNLNAADAEMLRGFFGQGLRLDYALADRLAQSIMDWRDQDELPRAGGAERDDYLRAGAAVLPANAPFSRIDELRHVLGMTPEIFEAARPYLILVSSGRVNLNAAPEAVLYALPGMTPAAVTEILQLRDAGTLPDDRESLLDLLSSTASRPLRDAGREFSGRVSFRTDEVEIISTGRVEGSPVESRVRVIVARADFGAAVVSRQFD